jgi:hypothetical protein
MERLDRAKPTDSVKLVLYDKACAALAKAVSVDEVVEIKNEAIALKAYARQAKNKEMEAKAVELRMRATRKLGLMMQKQKETVGLAKGGAEPGVGRRGKNAGSSIPRITKPTYEEAGIDKNLAKDARALATLTDKQFDKQVEEISEIILAPDAKSAVNVHIKPAQTRSKGAKTKPKEEWGTDLKNFLSDGLLAANALIKIRNSICKSTAEKQAELKAKVTSHWSANIDLGRLAAIWICGWANGTLEAEADALEEQGRVRTTPARRGSPPTPPEGSPPVQPDPPVQPEGSPPTQPEG